MTQVRKPYPSDVSDEEWSLVVPYLVLMREDAEQGQYDLRELFNGLRYVIRYGIACETAYITVRSRLIRFTTRLFSMSNGQCIRTGKASGRYETTRLQVTISVIRFQRRLPETEQLQLPSGSVFTTEVEVTSALRKAER